MDLGVLFALEAEIDFSVYLLLLDVVSVEVKILIARIADTIIA